MERFNLISEPVFIFDEFGVHSGYLFPISFSSNKVCGPQSALERLSLCVQNMDKKKKIFKSHNRVGKRQPDFHGQK